MQDIVDHLTATIRDAAARGRPLCIRGGGTKDFYGGERAGDILDATPCRGIVSYEPTELVITARAGTPLAEIEAALREKGQMLAFEPPHFGEIPAPPASIPGGEAHAVPPERKGKLATLGGCVAAGLSGPRRACAGAVRDFVLGVRMLDGRGNDLRFGGQVMKNVAGYDVSRLVTGSLGTLGMLLEISVKVLPIPPMEATRAFECSEAGSLELVNGWAGKPWPVSGTAFRGGALRVRLSGAPAAVHAAAEKLGGEAVEAGEAARFWSAIREQTHAYFMSSRPLWRLSVNPASPPLPLPGEGLIEWGGALRWLRPDADAGAIRGAAAVAGGHATLFRGGDRAAGVFHPLPAALLALHRRLKQAFDPAGILNPGRLYPGL